MEFCIAAGHWGGPLCFVYLTGIGLGAASLPALAQSAPVEMPAGCRAGEHSTGVRIPASPASSCEQPVRVIRLTGVSAAAQAAVFSFDSGKLVALDVGAEVGSTGWSVSHVADDHAFLSPSATSGVSGSTGLVLRVGEALPGLKEIRHVEPIRYIVEGMTAEIPSPDSVPDKAPGAGESNQ